MGVPYMDECEDGEWVLLDDVIKLLNTLEGHDAMYNAVEGEPEMKTLIELIKGETK
jgi:hypothetical protein